MLSRVMLVSFMTAGSRKKQGDVVVVTRLVLREATRHRVGLHAKY